MIKTLGDLLKKDEMSEEELNERKRVNNVIYDIVAWESNLGHYNIVVNKDKVDSYIKLLKQLDNFF